MVAPGIPFRVRGARTEDMAPIAAIYGEYVRSSPSTFAYEHEAPSAVDMRARWVELTALGMPYLVAESDAGAVVGYAYAGPFRSRAGWRFTVEDSIYVAPGSEGRGIGKALLATLLAACTEAGFHSVVAMISAMHAGGVGSVSRAMHAAAGFVEAGRIVEAGTKFGSWIDCLIMQKSLGAEAEHKAHTNT